MTWQPDFLKHLEGLSKLSQLTALTAIEDLQAKAEESQRNNAAESAEVRRSLWGENVSSKAADEEMRTTILGDMTHPAPVVMPPPQSNLLPLALLALAAAVPTTGAIGVAGYLLANRPQLPAAVQPAFDDSTVRIGLGRIEDLIQEDKK